MLPVIGVVLATALIVILSLRFVGSWHLERAVLTGKSSSDYAEVYFVQGRKEVLKIREIAASVRLENIQKDPQALNTNSLGSIKDNETLAKGIQSIEKALEIDSSHQLSHHLMSMLQWYQGNESLSYFHLAEYYRLQNLDSQAITAYQMACQKDPKNSRALAGLTLTLLNLNRTDEAWELANSKEDLLTTSLPGKFAMGSLYNKKGQFDKAEPLLKDALSQGLMEPLVVRELSTVAGKTNRHQEIADFLMKVGQDSPRANTTLYHVAAIHYRNVNLYPQEEKALRHALETFPNSGLLHYELSINLYEQGKFEAAKTEFNIATQYDFDSVMKSMKKKGVDPRKTP